MKNKFTKAKIGRHNYKSQIEDNIYKMLDKLEEITEIIFQEENTKIIEVKESLYLWGTYLTLGITQVNKEEEWEEEVQGLRKNIKRLDELYNLNTWIQDAEQKETTKTQINKVNTLNTEYLELKKETEILTERIISIVEITNIRMPKIVEKIQSIQLEEENEEIEAQKREDIIKSLRIANNLLWVTSFKEGKSPKLTLSKAYIQQVISARSMFKLKELIIELQVLQDKITKIEQHI